MKLLSNFINMREYNVNFADICEYVPLICTLAQSRHLALLLEPTGYNLQASGVCHSLSPDMPNIIVPSMKQEE